MDLLSKFPMLEFEHKTSCYVEMSITLNLGF
jgi:hypothetical protein